MDLHEIVAPTMKELFIKEIEGKILSGEWKTGDRLPSEREMEKKTKVSRTIINSALTELSQNGFVKIIPRKGVFVDDYTRNGQLTTLLSIINFQGGKLNKKTFDSLTDYRLLFDCECVSLAAKNRTDEDLILLKDIFNKMNSSTDTEEILNLKFRFLHTIYFATGNNIYPLVCNSFKELCNTFNKIIFKHYGCDIDSMHIPELIEAIEYHDSEKARTIMKDYLTKRIADLNQLIITKY